MEIECEYTVISLKRTAWKKAIVRYAWIHFIRETLQHSTNEIFLAEKYFLTRKSNYRVCYNGVNVCCTFVP